MKILLLLCTIILASCMTSQTVYRVAKDKGLMVKKSGGINLFAGSLEFVPKELNRKNPIYLLYDGDKLKYVTAKKSISPRDCIYHLQRMGDSIFMLTRSGQSVRYFMEDTILFYNNYAVQSVCLWDGDAFGQKKVVVQNNLTSFHFNSDSILIFRNRNNKPPMAVSQFGLNETVTQLFITSQSSLTKMRATTKEDLVRQIIN